MSRVRRHCTVCGKPRKTDSTDVPYTCRTCKPKPPKKKGPRRSPPKKRGPYTQKGVKKEAKTPEKTPASEDHRDVGQRQRDAAQTWRAKTSSAVRDIAMDGDLDLWAQKVQGINWETRLESSRDLKFFSEEYLPAVFYLGWSDDQLKCLRKVESVFTEEGVFSLAMPRGGGKTAICRSGTLWGTAHAHKAFPFLVGSSAPKATQTLGFIRTYWYRSVELRRDFPEIGYPVDRLENRFHLARGQTFRGTPTFIEWGQESICYPCLLFDERDRDVWISSAKKTGPLAEAYAENFLQEVIHPDTEKAAWIPRSAGTIVRTAGIDGSIRGDAEVHPVTLTQPRPDVVLLDDIQKDQRADSPASCDKLIRLIDGAVSGLAGPGNTIAALMPCTVIRDGDVSDTYLDRIKKPEWRGERCRMVLSWPEGITDFEITLDTPAGMLWNQYAEERIKSLRLFEDTRLATEFYAENQEAMDENFTVSWSDRYDKRTITVDGKEVPRELSAQQHSMNLRLIAPATFPAEYQNVGRREDGGAVILIDAKQLSEKIVDLDRGVAPSDTTYISAFIDVQNEVLFWGIFATAPDFTGTFIDYGTWPSVATSNFTKAQAGSWSLLTKAFFEMYPQHRDKAIRTASGKVRAPLEAKIYFALQQLVPQMMSRVITRDDAHGTTMKIQKLGIDTRWGQVTDTIKRYTRECGYGEVVPCFGQGLPPTHRQFEEYTRTKGWLFEDQVNPQVKEVKWVLKPDPAGQFSMAIDASRMKDFLMARLGSPLGAVGSITLFRAAPEDHLLMARHVTESEYPEPVTARGLTKNQWKERGGRPDNDYLDVFANCLALASFLGTYLPTDGGQKRDSKAFQKRSQGRLSDRYTEKRGRP